MIANYHTHTARCGHAAGTEDEYVQQAIQSGLKILGFSDHTPYWFAGEYYSRMRMLLMATRVCSIGRMSTLSAMWVLL